MSNLPATVEAIARSISARLSPDEAKAFDAAIAAAAAAAAASRDLSLLPWQFLAAELRGLPPQSPEIEADVNSVIAGIDRLAAGQEWPKAAAATKTARAARADWAAGYAATDWAVHDPSAKTARAARAGWAAGCGVYVILLTAARAGWVANPDAIAIATTAIASNPAVAPAGPAAARRQANLLLQLLAGA